LSAPLPEPLIARAVDWASRLAGYVAIALIVSAVVVICQMLFIRFVLNQSAIWQNEYVTFALIGATFLGAPYVLLTRGHVNVDLLPIYAGPGFRKLLAMVAGALGLVFCLTVFVTSLEWWWEAYSLGFRTSSVWRARLWIAYLPVPIGSGLLVLQYLVEIWRVLTGRAPPFGIAAEEPR
jgi:TRAP-type C4-dicarboxylate transport system permease small subunit